MLKKKYIISLALISFYSCHEAPGTVNEKFIKEKHDKYLSNKKKFLESLTETELATGDVQGFYNWLRDYQGATNDPDLKQLLADIDIAKSFCNGFSFLYNSLNIANNNTIDFSLGIIDNEKSNSIIKMVINFENLLTKQKINFYYLFQMKIYICNKKQGKFCPVFVNYYLILFC